MQDTAQQSHPPIETRPTAGGDGSASSSLGRVPDFFIVGHPKCGTTALYEMLRSHPEIHMPAKEPRFFAMQQIELGAGARGEVGTGSQVRSVAIPAGGAHDPRQAPRL